MAVIKLSNNKNSVMFIDERGFVYVYPKKKLQWAMNGNQKDFMVPVLMPGRVASDRYMQSPIFVNGECWSLKEAFDNGLIDSSFYSSITVSEDYMERASLEKKSKQNNKKEKTPIGDVKL